MITIEQLAVLGIDGKWAEALQAVFEKYDLSNSLRQASFTVSYTHLTLPTKRIV